MLIQMLQLVCLYLACRQILDTHILTNTHTTDAIPSIGGYNMGRSRQAMHRVASQRSDEVKAQL